ncbi:hypothetical protein BKA56DRAFT_9183 [Ilyonectria sp. MPI-CAGE-AT-0026]|nr:hypothetical protein BKA56DRAFT_9183 [Ilyonectria sp. MPI-CAGE-AT-0026]
MESLRQATFPIKGKDTIACRWIQPLDTNCETRKLSTDGYAFCRHVDGGGDTSLGIASSRRPTQSAPKLRSTGRRPSALHPVDRRPLSLGDLHFRGHHPGCPSHLGHPCPLHPTDNDHRSRPLKPVRQPRDHRSFKGFRTRGRA